MLETSDDIHIDLHLPAGWNAMTTEQLEMIGTACRETAKECMARRKPYDATEAKVKVFLALTGLELIERSPRGEVEEGYFLVRCKGKDSRLKRALHRLFRRKYNDVFEIGLWQLQSFMESRMQWFDQTPNFYNFPYPTLCMGGFMGFGKRRFSGPAVLAQDWEWRQYRIAGELAEYYMKCENRYLRMAVDPNASPTDVKKLYQQSRTAKGMFLAALFCEKVRHVDNESGVVVTDYCYMSGQSNKNAKLFASLPDEKFQVVLFWWSSFMTHLQGRYPKCFGKQSAKKPKVKDLGKNPLDFYARCTATLEKYLGLDEQKVAHEKYAIILQHLQDISDENERVEKMNQK